MSDFKNYLNTFVFDTVLPGSGKTIKFKPITTGQLKNMLLYQDVEDAGKIELALDQLITECVVSEDFDINDLYLQDRFFLLVEIRKCSKGNVYSFQAKCGSCDSQTMINITLNNLIVNKLKPIFVDDDKPSVITVKRVKNNIKTDSEIVYLILSISHPTNLNGNLVCLKYFIHLYVPRPPNGNISYNSSSVISILLSNHLFIKNASITPSLSVEKQLKYLFLCKLFNNS